MVNDIELVAAKLRRWEKNMGNIFMPRWEDIPDIGLYMNQMLNLLTQYLDYLPPELRDEEFITAATVNNYVRRKIIPEPVGKKYYRKHLAYLIMLCTLKQSMSITMAQIILPAGLSEEALRALYDAFSARYRLVRDYFIQQVRLSAAGITGCPETGPLNTDSVPELITQSAIVAGFSRLLAEKLLLLEQKTDDAPASSCGD